VRDQRLELALAEGRFAPEGVIVLRPRLGDDLSALPGATVLTGFRPDHDHFARSHPTEARPSATALVCLPRSKDLALALIAEAVTLAPLVVLDGQKTDGFDGILREVKRAGYAVSEVLSKAHGKLMTFPAGPAPEAWKLCKRDIGGFVTQAGVFSADAPDEGSRLLAEALPASLPAKVGDLGAGWGYLSRAILAREGVKSLDLVEAEALALDCARENIQDARAAFHWADATTFRAPRLWGAVVMNPPFHSGREADLALGQAFLRAAHRGLAPDGSLYMVANRHLAYEPLLKTLFHKVEEIGGTGAFRLTRAAFPNKRHSG
jgi:16S rRNA (guanine1207-N2)-methyltransferase